MIAICTSAASQTSESVGRTGSLRRIDEILAELLAGYAVAETAVDGAPVAATEKAAAVGEAEPLVAGLVALPGDAGACCSPAAESVATV
jgi:hypothetical protein